MYHNWDLRVGRAAQRGRPRQPLTPPSHQLSHTQAPPSASPPFRRKVQQPWKQFAAPGGGGWDGRGGEGRGGEGLSSL